MEVGGGEREIIYLSLHCHHQNDFCIKMGSDESHFNVSVGSDGQSHKTVSTNHNLFKEKGEPKRYRTEVLPLTSLTPYRWATPAQTSRYWSRHFKGEPCTAHTHSRTRTHTLSFNKKTSKQANKQTNQCMYENIQVN